MISMKRFFFFYRTSHRVILGEHDRSSNSEPIQTMTVGQVKKFILIISTQNRNSILKCFLKANAQVLKLFSYRSSSIPTTTASPSTMTSLWSSWPPRLSSACRFLLCALLKQMTTSPGEWSVWHLDGAWPDTMVDFKIYLKFILFSQHSSSKVLSLCPIAYIFNVIYTKISNIVIWSTL